ncbi:ABC transporter permease subunit [Nocardioides sp. Bht2]|uniref:ABC transporter permease subunit n=1 Tax=Nocardioides sp. Bht2 TaxID=3392297 RepID=UPI0039B599D0
MNAALKYEWARLTSLRSTWWISGGAILISVGFTFFVAMSIQLSTPGELEGSADGDYSRFILDAAMTQFSNVDPSFYLLAYIVAIMGVLAWGHEYRHGMIRATLTAVPNRNAVWSAKLIVVGAWVSAIVVITCLLSLLVTLLWFVGLDFEFDLPYLMGAVFSRIVFTVLLTWLVMGATVLIRHQTFSLVMLYLWPLGIENMVRLLFSIVAAINGDEGIYQATRFLPFNAGGRIIQNWSISSGDLQRNLDLFGDPLSAWGGFLVFGGFTAAVLVGSLVAFNKRDA